MTRFQRAPAGEAEHAHTSLLGVAYAQAALSGVLEWAGHSATEPVLSALGDHTSPTTGAQWPRAWRAPGGLLGLLPIQAASCHIRPLTGAGRRTGRREQSDLFPHPSRPCPALCPPSSHRCRRPPPGDDRRDAHHW
jgi:hypothetical protein